MTKISGVLVRVLLEAIERYDVGPAQLLSGGTLTLAELDADDARIELTQFAALVLRALHETRVPWLGLQIVDNANDGTFDLLGHMVPHARTLREAIALCVRFTPLLIDDGGMSLSERFGTATLAIDFVHTEPLADALLRELAMVGLLRLLRIFGGSKAMPELVYFEHQRPSYHHEYARAFGGVERFGQTFTGIAFASSYLDRPRLVGGSELQAVLTNQAERALDRLARPADELERVARYVSARVPGRVPDMRTAAQDLGMSVRSLRRRLAEHHTSYRELVQSALQSTAERLLRQPRASVQETAHAVGFADVTSFHRAFKRWTGHTPDEFRQTRRD